MNDFESFLNKSLIFVNDPEYRLYTTKISFFELFKELSDNNIRASVQVQLRIGTYIDVVKWNKNEFINDITYNKIIYFENKNDVVTTKLLLDL